MFLIIKVFVKKGGNPFPKFTLYISFKSAQKGEGAKNKSCRRASLLIINCRYIALSPHRVPSKPPTYFFWKRSILVGYKMKLTALTIAIVSVSSS